ncbi:MAG: EVE domain-containing protein [Archaeoglobaceae archaeon]
MTHWLYITDTDVWRGIVKHNVVGLPEVFRHRLEEVNIGDNIAVCGVEEGKKEEPEPVIYGVFKVVSEPFRDENIIFESTKAEIYPERIKVEPERVPAEPVFLQDTVGQLEMVTSKTNWEKDFLAHLIRKISDSDFEKLKAALG